jgi:hypothetical protein
MRLEKRESQPLRDGVNQSVKIENKKDRQMQEENVVTSSCERKIKRVGKTWGLP